VRHFAGRLFDLSRKAVLYSGFLIKEQLGNRIDSYLAAHRLWQHSTAHAQ
jgi:hypothetical protein